MRFAPAVLLVSSVTLSCLTTSFEHSSPKRTDVNTWATPRSTNNDVKGISAFRLLEANETTNQEQRMPSALGSVMDKIEYWTKNTGINLASQWIREGKTVDDVMTMYHPKGTFSKTYKYPYDFYNSLDKATLVAMVRLFSVKDPAKKNPTEKDLDDSFSFLDIVSERFGHAATAQVLYKVGRHGNWWEFQLATEMLDHRVNGWLRMGKSPIEVLRLLDFFSEVPFSYQALTVLQAYIYQISYSSGTKFTLTDTLLKAIRDVADLSSLEAVETTDRLTEMAFKSSIK